MHRRTIAAAVSAALVSFTLLPGGGGPAVSAVGPVEPVPGSTVVLDWERTLFDTVYTDNATPIPIGVPFLGYTSLAMYDALGRAQRMGNASGPAAVAVAAHDVLAHYFPASGTELASELDASLASVPDGASKTRGQRAGAAAARSMVATHQDPRLNPDGITYDLAAGPGVWQPAAGGTMLAPWLGSLDPLVVQRPIKVDGPDPITSAAYAVDYEEVKRIGALVGADRTDFQTETAVFFNSNSATMVGAALLGHLEAHPLSLRETVRMFAVMHGAMTDALITCWRLKRDEGFWRPSQAIPGGDTDGNPATEADPTWKPLLPMPPYSDYVSGHACLTGPAVETVRMVLGEDTDLTLHSVNPGPIGSDRTYSTLSEIEFDALHARIWGGFHFRDAMDDGYLIGHTAARRAMHALR